MDHSDYTVVELSNGLRFVHRRTESHVGYAGVVIGAGSRDENSTTHGLAHFVEHTIFKGTTHRSSRQINNRLESIGGELNAYTSKEETLYFANTPAGNSARALELLYDLMAYSNFPAEAVEREHDVVIEEISSCLDNPADSIFDEFEDRIYAGSGLGHNILGTEKSVGSLGPEDCHGFVERFYRPRNMVVYCASPEPVSRVMRDAERWFGQLRLPGTGVDRKTPSPVAPFSEIVDRGGHQAHTMIGARVFGRDDPRSHALFLLNNYLGGPGMSSILNDELREKRGYVYTVESNVALMSDCGLWTVYFGSDRKMADRCARLVGKAVERLASDRISDRRLQRIKRQYTGQLRVASDHRESMAMSMGKSVAFYGEVHDIDWISRRIEEVTAEELREVAQMIAPSLCSRLTLC